MDLSSRLINLSSQASLEAAEEMDCHFSGFHRQNVRPLNISHAVLSSSQTVSLLKTVLTSVCERDCYYCPFRAGRDFRRAAMKPMEMAQAFIAMRKAGIVDGLFLSSGIAGGGVRVQDRLIDTVDILRTRFQFTGHIHLKIMPGAERDQILRAMQLANRVSINLEAPNTQRLQALAPRKSFSTELLEALKVVHEIRSTIAPDQAFKQRWPSVTTQFVVGAAGESDLEILQTTAQLQQDLGLSRTYFSAFTPIQNTPLENHPPTSPLRQDRLYQASFLLRDYRYNLEELPFNSSGNLPLETDPKLAWAKEHLSEHPIEVNRASKWDLLRVPGIGLKSAELILSARKDGKISQESDLRKLGIRTNNLAPFVLFDGKRPGAQLALWPVN